jgi:hypothetical protein
MQAIDDRETMCRDAFAEPRATSSRAVERAREPS